MVACFIALIVFAVLGIFSAKYRQLAKEAFRCVFLKITFRPCDVGLDKKIKAGVLAPILDRSPPVANFVNKHFELLSLIFLIISLVSLAYVLVGFYNFILYGTCDPANPTGFCPYQVLTGSNGTTVTGPTGNPICPNTEEGIVFGPKDAKVEIIEFGCFSCPYTKGVEPTVQKILQNYPEDVRYVYKVLPIETHSNSRKAAMASICAYEQDKYWEYREVLFNHQQEFQANAAKLLEYAKQLNLNETEFNGCMNSRDVEEKIAKLEQEGLSSNIRGTPTFFVNHKYVEPGNLESTVDWEINGSFILTAVALFFLFDAVFLAIYFYSKKKKKNGNEEAKKESSEETPKEVQKNDEIKDL
ncbi:MAG: thioredoxin domain-containing protein [Candidatus Micrarchaeota archaeon]